MKERSTEEKTGKPRVEEAERDAEDEDVIEGVVDGVGETRAEAEADGGAEPFGEGADVGAEEGVESVGEGVVGPEPAVGESGQSHPRAHRVHQVRTRARHCSDCEPHHATRVWFWCDFDSNIVR